MSVKSGTTLLLALILPVLIISCRPKPVGEIRLGQVSFDLSEIQFTERQM
jgi:hypothetical protein